MCLDLPCVVPAAPHNPAGGDWPPSFAHEDGGAQSWWWDLPGSHSQQGAGQDPQASERMTGPGPFLSHLQRERNSSEGLRYSDLLGFVLTQILRPLKEGTDALRKQGTETASNLKKFFLFQLYWCINNRLVRGFELSDLRFPWRGVCGFHVAFI